MPAVRRKKTLTEEVVEQILSEIRRRRLRSGDPLPTESELMLLFGVSRVALREAFCYLKGLGLIVSRRGSCLRVANPGLIDLLENLIGRIILPEAEMINELFELRRTLELGCIADAVENADPNQLEAIENARLLFEELSRETPPDPRKLDEAEINFHIALFRSSECRMLGVVMTALREFFHHRIWRENDANWCTPENLRKLCAEHRNIANAFRSRSPEEAYSAIRNHLRKV